MTIVTKPSEPVGRDARAGTEFGGPWALLASLVALPAVVYYFWISVEFYVGALPLPASPAPDDVLAFVDG